MAYLSYVPFSTATNYYLPPTRSSSVRKIVLCCLPSNQEPNGEPITGLRVAFAAGGTGGHIYPAIAIADELKVKNPRAEILFVGSAKSMESTSVRSAGYDFIAVPCAPLARPLLSLKNLFLPLRLIKSMIKSYKILREFDPQIVVGTGGYVSFPLCFIAALKGITLVIQEQNAVPGIANWVLSHFADLVFVAFNSTVDSFPKHKCLVYGNPVRLSLKQEVSKTASLSHFFPNLGDSEGAGLRAKVVLVLGGSLGANSINIAMLNLYYQMLMENESVFIIWQTGVESFNEMESLVRGHPRLLLRPFLKSMDLAYAAADLLVSRAGAMTCSEILAAGKPAILIPSPNVSEGHQFKNASLMADSAGSSIITEDELDSITLKSAIEELLGNEDKLLVMSERAFKAAKPDASAVIVDRILSLVASPLPS
ncbi:hypothetical protein SAY87_026574 [Trapa incisa]|uniref:Undecaprenyldiphospho-muramoylpentapeptide beta-N-acetylglucosaminyltransferase n=1 Tax=Trapa incisa TaxID=236973 RepID=A0AAN7JM27_9MYRT|nr:hypothetical protein SAY87_026574 [Trapa incisa]